VTSAQGPLFRHFEEIEEKCRHADPSLNDIAVIFGPEGHYLLIFFLILPFLQPIPLLGLSTPFGLLIATSATLAYLAKPPWIPQRWGCKKIKASTVLKIVESSEKIFKRLSFLFRERWNFFFNGPFKMINTILVVFNAVILTLPLPIPFSNTFPAWMIVFYSLAYLEKDGLFVLLSYMQTVLCIIYFLFVAKGVGSGIHFLGF
jgi:hypothetical protein